MFGLFLLWIFIGSFIALSIVGIVSQAAERDLKAFTVTMLFVITIGLSIYVGSAVWPQQVAESCDRESQMIECNCKRISLLKQFKEIRSIQISNNSDHLDYTCEAIGWLMNDDPTFMGWRVGFAQDRLDFIKCHKFMLK